MRCARSAAWASTAGFHHGIAQEDVVGGGQVQARAARLQRHQHHRRPVVGLEARDDAARGRACSVEARERQLGARQRRLDQVEQAVHCENTSALCPSAAAVSSASSSASTFDDVCARWPGTSAGWHAAWRRRSSASSALHARRLPSLEQRQHVLLRGGADRVVDGALAARRARRAARLRCAAAARARRPS